jgi:HAD superfamily hydrolase (TIGR01509 family)
MTAEAAVLFAVDGTLVDSSNLNTLTWWEALWQNGHPLSMAQVRQTLDKGGDQLLDQLIGPDRDHNRDELIIAEHHSLFARYWAALRPFDAAAELLRSCASRGWTVVLVSSASARELAVLCERLDAPDAIATAISAEDAAAGKPAADLLRAALTQVGAVPEHAVFVGGSVWDVEASRAVGVPCIALMAGGSSGDELLAAGAAEVHKDAAALLDGIEASLLARPHTVTQPVAAVVDELPDQPGPESPQQQSPVTA